MATGVTDPTDRAGRPLLRGARLGRTWVAVTTVGELAAFAVPAVVAGLLTARGAPDAVAVPVIVAAGAVEGAVLGMSQAWVLVRAVRGLRARGWVAYTSAGAAGAYSVGMAPSVLYPWLRDLPLPAVVLLGTLAAAVLLCCLAVPQAMMLRRHLRHGWHWAGWTVSGWGAGLAAFGLVSPPLWQPGQSAAVVAAIGLLGGLAMAVVAAAITGWGLVRICAAGPAVR
jgi:hypothetical protein